MAWCPICKNEYDNAVNICNSCNCLLLKGDSVNFTELLCDESEEIVLTAFNNLTDNGFESAQYYCDSDDVYHLIIAKEDYDDAKRFLLDEDEEELINAEDLYAPVDSVPVSSVSAPQRSVKPYVKLSDKVADLKSSAFSLLIVGVLGAIFLVLEYLDVFNFNFTATAHIIFYIVMGIMFGGFIILGIASLVSMIKLKPLAEKHAQITKDVMEYAEENFNKENADKAVELSVAGNKSSDIDDLFYYYQRARLIRIFITEKFDIDDASFLDYLVEELYSKFFDNDDISFSHYFYLVDDLYSKDFGEDAEIIEDNDDDNNDIDNDN